MQIVADGEGAGDAAAGEPTARRSWLRIALFLAITAGLLALVLWQVDLRQTVAALRGARWIPVIVAGLISLVGCNGACIMRLWTLLRELPVADGQPGAPPAERGADRSSLRDVASIYLATTAAHNLLPSFAGDALRTVQLHRSQGYAVGTLVAAQVSERVIESLGLSLLALAGAAVLPQALARPLGVLALLCFAGVALLLFIGWRGARLRSARPDPDSALATSPSLKARLMRLAQSSIAQLSEGVYHLRRPATWGVALVWSIAADVLATVTVGLCLYAVDVSAPVSAWLVAMLMGRLAGLVPTTPGQFGVLEATMVMGLALCGVEVSRALPCALLFHLAHFLPVTVVGLIEARRHL